jgi:hypothetical protein
VKPSLYKGATGGGRNPAAAVLWATLALRVDLSPAGGSLKEIFETSSSVDHVLEAAGALICEPTSERSTAKDI